MTLQLTLGHPERKFFHPRVIFLRFRHLQEDVSTFHATSTTFLSLIRSLFRQIFQHPLIMTVIIMALLFFNIFILFLLFAFKFRSRSIKWKRFLEGRILHRLLLGYQSSTVKKRRQKSSYFRIFFLYSLFPISQPLLPLRRVHFP